MNFQSFASFLSGYLHQDWDLEYSDAQTAARAFASSENDLLVLTTLGEIAVLVASQRDDMALERYLTDAGCYYRPTDSTVRDWLIGLTGVIAKEASIRWP